MQLSPKSWPIPYVLIGFCNHVTLDHLCNLTETQVFCFLFSALKKDNKIHFIGFFYEDQMRWCIKALVWDFPGGTVVKSLPANAGDMGSSPGPAGSHMPWGN